MDLFPIIDIHSHILPGVDDGARNMEMTREMLRLAWNQGIRAIIATPHYRAGQYGASADHIKKLTEEVQSEARKLDPDFRIYSGNELFYTEGSVDALNEGYALTLAGTSYVLVEFYPGVSANECIRAARKLGAACYTPVIAHAERYGCLRKQGVLEELKKAGALIQINGNSVSGAVFDSTARWVRRMAREGMIDFIGTDTHNLTTRKPDMKQAVSTLTRLVGQEGSREILWKNPGRLLENQYI